MDRSDVAGAATKPCPCCGSDPSRYELDLDNGFGLELHARRDEAAISWGNGETEPSDFAGFYIERRAFLAMWLLEAEAELAPAEYKFWSRRAKAAFARGIEQEACALDIDFSAADVAADLIHFEIEMKVVFNRLGPCASGDAIAAEYMQMLRNGLTVDEVALVSRLRDGIAGAIERNGHELSRQIGQRLRDPGGSSYFSFRQWRAVDGVATVTRARRSGIRTPRARRQVRRARARAPSRKPPEPEPPLARRRRR